MYDPTLGLFLQEDPIGIAAGDPNFYRYCGNNPILYTDPTGLEVISVLRRDPSGFGNIDPNNPTAVDPNNPHWGSYSPDPDPSVHKGVMPPSFQTSPSWTDPAPLNPLIRDILDAIMGNKEDPPDNGKKDIADRDWEKSTADPTAGDPAKHDPLKAAEELAKMWADKNLKQKALDAGKPLIDKLPDWLKKIFGLDSPPKKCPVR